MTLVERINNDMIMAMKNKEKERLMVIRMVKAAIQQEHIDRKREINDELALDVISKQIKMRNDSILAFEKADRYDLASKNKIEVEILKAYLPEQLSTLEIEKIIDEIFVTIKPTSGKDMGLIMKEVTPRLKGRADMKQVSEMIKNKLN